MSEASVIVNGETVIDLHLQRHREGVLVQVWVDPKLEEFFQHWSGGQKEDARIYGRSWRNIIPGNPLLAWTFPREEGLDDIYTLWNLSGSLREDGRLNISYLRLVGASEPGGITFIAEQVQSREYLEKVCYQMKRAGRRFYTEFIEPVHLQVQIAAVTKSGSLEAGDGSNRT